MESPLEIKQWSIGSITANALTTKYNDGSWKIALFKHDYTTYALLNRSSQHLSATVKLSGFLTSFYFD